MAEANHEQRSKRQRIDKNGRFAALKKLKELKGQKNKYTVNEDADRVYDIVDESEFAKRSREKYGNDWIEEDGTGYVEDGRDIFEDDEYYSGEEGEAPSEKKNRKGKKRGREEEKPANGKSSIKNLFKNAVVKKRKEAPVNIAEDDILADVLGELDTEQDKSNKNLSTNALKQQHISSRMAAKQEALAVKDYVQNFMSTMKKCDDTNVAKSNPTDDEIIERVLKPLNKKSQLPPIKENEILECDSKPSNDLSESSSIEKVQKTNENLVIPEQNELDEMDYSILDDDENQFVNEKVEIKPAEKAKEKSNHVETENDSKNILDNWENCNFDCFDEDLTIETNEEPAISKDVLKMWFWDAWEDPKTRPGQVFLFGKVGNAKESKSVCVQVTNVDHCLFLLPRKYMYDPKTKQPTTEIVTDLDMHSEFTDEIAPTLGLNDFKSKRIMKNFAFEMKGVDIPPSNNCFEIRYDGKLPTPNPKKAYKSIEYIFGTNASALETLLLECKIKGPCWLNITNFIENKSPLSWCKVEVTCSNIKHIKVADDQKIPPPPISVLSVNVRTALNPKTNRNEVVMISYLANNRFFVDKPPPAVPFNQLCCGLSRPQAIAWPLDATQKLSEAKNSKLTKLDTERSLLSWFLASYQKTDPDLIVTHDAYDCQLDVIADRIAALKIPMWSRLGRLRRTHAPQKSKRIQDFFVGRLICDVKKSAEELIKSRSFDLETLCINVLHKKEGYRMDVTNEDLYLMYESGEGILKLVTLTIQDCLDVLRIMCELNVIPLALQITQICGNLMSHTLIGGRAERVEHLLLHAFTEKQYVVPDKIKREASWEQGESSTQINQTTSNRKKSTYVGGLVFDPVKGFYDKLILLMDFNSLYPSIIQEYNICFTTITPPDNEEDQAILPEPGTEQGVLPRQIRRLVESRREVKKLMANPDLDKDIRSQYEIRQKALKITANAMYGCLGAHHSRFFAQHLASLVTAKGREILTNTKNLVQKLNYDVIYGDTDSLMINTNIIDYDQVFKIGHTIKQNVNRIYKQIELEIDGVFKYLLLLKKKKYAALVMEKNKKGEIVLKQEHKGLDIVRRDWSKIAILAGSKVLDEILSDNQLDEKIENIHSGLEKCKEEILSGTVPLPLLEITKQLTRAPKDYASVASLPHVQVALRMNQTRNKRYKKGDMVSYIICDDGTNNAPMQRAYHMEEIRSNEKLKVDTLYYLGQQIHSVVSRLCEPLEGTDASRIASCLGLDPNKYRAAAQRVQRERMEEGDGVAITKSVIQKYRQCEKFKFTCVSCRTENIVASAFKPKDSKHVAALEKCSNSECSQAPFQQVTSIRNQLILTMRGFIGRFYDNWMVCDDPACNSNTRTYSHVTKGNRIVCQLCQQGNLIRQYSEKDLFTQLDYFQYIFDLSKHEDKNATLSIEVEGAYNTLRETVEQQLANSAYCRVNLSRLFSNLNVTKAVPLMRGKNKFQQY